MIIYTDGSAHPNPGTGGFGVVVLDNSNKLLTAYSRQFINEKVTNNEMELKAILYTMLNYGTKSNQNIPIVYSDSSYCVNTLNEWMFNWKKNGWLKSNNSKPENLNIIKAYYDWYSKGYRIELRKIKGHSGFEFNELADKLATGKISVEEVFNIYE